MPSLFGPTAVPRRKSPCVSQIPAAAVETLHSLGPEHFRNFSGVVERGLTDDTAGARALLALQDAMICNYNPAACEEDKCMESSTSELEYVDPPHQLVHLLEIDTSFLIMSRLVA